MLATLQKDHFETHGDVTIYTPMPIYICPNARQMLPFQRMRLVQWQLTLSWWILQQAGAKYSSHDVTAYTPKDSTTGSLVFDYAKLKWRLNVPHCAVRPGVGHERIL
jgi:hypothetical protein